MTESEPDDPLLGKPRTGDPHPEASGSHRVIEPSVLYVGTPVYLVATRSTAGAVNLAPASSHFALGRLIVLGLEEGGKSLENLRRHPELTVNFPEAAQWAHVERLAGVTGADPVPAEKAGAYEFEPDKFARAGLTRTPSDLVDVPRVAEAPLQLEARVRRITDGVDGVYGVVEAEVVRVHAAQRIAVEGTHHIDPGAWHPLLYSYRHFYDRGAEVGWTRKSPLARAPEEIERWESFGGTWRVSALTERSARVELCRCDGGEVVDTLVSEEPGFVRWATVQAAK